MRWEGRRESGNIEDRRGMSMGGVGLPLGGGVGGLVILLLVSWLTGTNPLDLISTSSVPQDQTTGTTGVRENDPQAKFISVVLADTELSTVDVENGVMMLVKPSKPDQLAALKKEITARSEALAASSHP